MTVTHHPPIQILSFGEALIDFKETQPNHFQSFAGGSPMNVAIAAARLGVATGFAGQISKDMFGQRLRRYLADNQVDTQFLLEHPAPSTLAFVSESAAGAEFSFFQQQAADTLYDPQPHPRLPESLQAISFGSVSLLTEPTASSITAIVRAQRATRVIFFDPNVRPNLIKDRAAYLRRLPVWLELSHISKVSRQDLAWLYPEQDIEQDIETVAQAWLEHGMQALIITDGAKGVKLFRPEHAPMQVPAPQVSVADTVGAGDTFSGSFLAEMVQKGYSQHLEELDAAQWLELLELATAAAAFNCTQHGAQPPTREALERFRAQQRLA